MFVRHILIIISVISFIPFGAHAQVGSQRHDLCIGVNGSVVLNKVGFTPRINQAFYITPSAGLTLRYTSERYYGMICAFQAEINYSGMGWRENVYSISNQRLDDEYVRNLGYIQVPILANLGFGKVDKGVKGYLVAGPQVAYLISDKERYSDHWTTIDGITPDRMNAVVQQYGLKVQNKFEYGITAGLGCELSTSIGHFMLEGRYYMGLSNLFSNTKSDPFSKSNHGSIIAKITYLFDVMH